MHQGEEKIRVKSAYVHFNGNYLTVVDSFDIVTEFWNFEEGFPVNVSMHLYDINGTIIFVCTTPNKPLTKGLHKVIFHIPGNLMNSGNYNVSNMFVLIKPPCIFFMNKHIPLKYWKIVIFQIGMVNGPAL